MRIIALRILRQFWTKHRQAEIPLRAWYAEASRADWAEPTDIKAAYISPSFLANNCVIFNIKGNDYRLVVAVHYNRRMTFIRFAGTHSEYDKIDAIVTFTVTTKFDEVNDGTPPNPNQTRL